MKSVGRVTVVFCDNGLWYTIRIDCEMFLLTKSVTHLFCVPNTKCFKTDSTWPLCSKTDQTCDQSILFIPHQRKVVQVDLQDTSPQVARQISAVPSIDNICEASSNLRTAVWKMQSAGAHSRQGAVESITTSMQLFDDVHGGIDGESR